MRAAVDLRIEDANGRKLGWHAFRRFVGTELAKQDPKLAQRQLDHVDPAITLRHYHTVDDESRVQAMAQIQSKFSSKSAAESLASTDSVGYSAGHPGMLATGSGEMGTASREGPIAAPGKVDMRITTICPWCEGTGDSSAPCADEPSMFEVCPLCNGSGEVDCED